MLKMKPLLRFKSGNLEAEQVAIGARVIIEQAAIYSRLGALFAESSGLHHSQDNAGHKAI